MKKRTRIFAGIFALLLTIGSFASIPVQAAKVKPKSIKVTKSSVTAYKGSEFELKATYSPTKAEDDYIIWSIVGKSGIVKFEDNDKTGDEVELIAVKAGTTRLKAAIKGTSKASYVTVTVKNPTYTFSRAGKASRTVTAGDEFELSVKKGGGLKDNHIKWFIDNKSIVAFEESDITDDEIELKAKKAGTTKVKAWNTKTRKTITYIVTVKAKPVKATLSKVGSLTKKVELGDDIDLKVKVTNTASKNLKWTIKNTSLLRFDDGERYGKEVEVEGRKLGTTTVTCKNTKTGKSITYTIKVVRDDD